MNHLCLIKTAKRSASFLFVVLVSACGNQTVLHISTPKELIGAAILVDGKKSGTVRVFSESGGMETIRLQPGRRHLEVHLNDKRWFEETLNVPEHSTELYLTVPGSVNAKP